MFRMYHLDAAADTFAANSVYWTEEEAADDAAEVAAETGVRPGVVAVDVPATWSLPDGITATVDCDDHGVLVTLSGDVADGDEDGPSPAWQVAEEAIDIPGMVFRASGPHEEVGVWQRWVPRHRPRRRSC